MTMQSVYALVDLAFVRQLGEAAIAGLSISFQVFFIILALSQIVAVTALSKVSQAYGSGDLAEARERLTTFVLLAAGIGVVSALSAYALAEPYVRAFTDDPEVFAFGLEYYRVNTITFLVQFLLIVFGNCFRGSGDFVLPVKLMLTSILINMILDPLLIFGLGPFPELGIAGAAWATVVGQSVACVIYFYRLSRPKSARALRWARPRFSSRVFVELFTRGLPAGLQFFLLSVVLGIVLAAMKEHGATWTATAGGGFRVLQQTFLPMVALGSAAAAITGQNLGGSKPARVLEVSRTALLWCAIYSTLMAIVLFFGGGIFGQIFIKSDAELPAAITYFQWSSPMLFALAMSFIPTWVLQAAGLAIYPMFAAIARIIALAALVFGLIPAMGLGPEWVFGAATASAFLEAAFGLYFLTMFLRRIMREAKERDAAPVEAAAVSPS